MRAGSAAKILSIVAGAGALALAVAAFLSFRAALSAKIDHAAELEAAAVRPAAAARLAAHLTAHRLALVAEKESHAVAGAFRREEAQETLDAYRRAGGSPALAEEARRALAAQEAPSPAADVAFLRAMRGLRAEAGRAPRPPRPEPPASARRAGSLLLFAGAAAAVSAALAYAAGRARSGSP